ncbi:hypothetical protein STENM223S_07556 [Streptomyces tendae]
MSSHAFSTPARRASRSVSRARTSRTAPGARRRSGRRTPGSGVPCPRSSSTRCRRRPGLLGDRPHGGPVVAALLEQPHGRLQDQGAGLLGLAEVGAGVGAVVLRGHRAEPNVRRARPSGRRRRRSRSPAGYGATRRSTTRITRRFVPPHPSALAVPAPPHCRCPARHLAAASTAPWRAAPWGVLRRWASRRWRAAPTGRRPGGGAPVDLPGVADGGDLGEGGAVVEAGEALAAPGGRGRDELQGDEPGLAQRASPRTWSAQGAVGVVEDGQPAARGARGARRPRGRGRRAALTPGPPGLSSPAGGRAGAAPAASGRAAGCG